MYYSTPVKSWKIFFKRFTILSYFLPRTLREILVISRKAIDKQKWVC